MQLQRDSQQDKKVSNPGYLNDKIIFQVMNTFLIYTLFKLFVGIKDKIKNHIQLKGERIRVKANLRPPSIKTITNAFSSSLKVL